MERNSIDNPASERIWFNGRVMPMADARIGVEDRGFQFADGVYEVIRIYNGRCFALREHMDRLFASAGAIRLNIPYTLDTLTRTIEQYVAADPLTDGMVYLQATRGGGSPRNHAYPAQCAPTMLFYTRELEPLPEAGAEGGMKLITLHDERWNKCWIKSTALLANVIAKNQALDAGADEAMFVIGDPGIVTECSTTNLFAVIDDVLITHLAGAKVLPGITRAIVLRLAADLEIEARERGPTLDEVRHADEVFITGTTREIMWVSHLDGKQLWARCGPMTLQLHQALKEEVARQTGNPHMRASPGGSRSSSSLRSSSKST